MSRVETDRAALADYEAEDARVNAALKVWREIHDTANVDDDPEDLDHAAMSFAIAAADALRAPAGGGSAGAEAMRERCAAYHDDLVAQHEAFAKMAEGYSSSALRAWKHHWRTARQHRTAAAAIRALPTDTTPPGSPDADGAEGRPDHPTKAAARAWVEGEVRGCERLEREG